MEINNEFLTLVLAAGPIVSLVTIAIRALLSRFGYESGRVVVQGVLLLLCIAVAVIVKYAPQEALAAIAGIFATAITFYDVVVKNLVGGILDKFKG